MGIQERLKKARYGELGYRMPVPKEINKQIPRPHNQLIAHHTGYTKTVDKIFYALYNPTPKDRYYKTSHKIILYDYKALPEAKRKRAWTYTVHNRLLRPLLYFHANPQYYGNNFEHFAVPWITATVFAMRATIMKDLYDQGKIPGINFYCQQSNGYYPFYKPMLNKTTINIANEIHNILEEPLEKYQKLIKRERYL